MRHVARLCDGAPLNIPKAFEIRAVHHGRLTDSARNLSKLGHLTGLIPP
jgi:hypothetical protein